MVYVLTQELVPITITLASDTVDTVCQKIQNNFLQTIRMYHRTLSKLLFSPIVQEKTLLLIRYLQLRGLTNTTLVQLAYIV